MLPPITYLNDQQSPHYPDDALTQTVSYRRALFATQLPGEYRYTRAHLWLTLIRGQSEHDSRWRVGYTTFGLRMIGELVDIQFEPPAGTIVKPGDVVGTIEGFKAINDIFSAGAGIFCRSNAKLKDSLKPLAETPHDAGWLYEFSGEPEPQTLDVDGYRMLLDETIDRLMARLMTETDAP